MSFQSVLRHTISPLRSVGLLCGTALAAAALPAAAATDVLTRPGGGQNRIEVTGNSASNVQVRCADGSTQRAAANVNSVNVDPKALRGRTTIVTGRNTQDVRVDGDCGARGARPAANINSVNIR
ncbi:MAG: hypothetical protein EOO24_12645 [Comamonadaceae bacterium]|nr:MAG: hypothetical protein EOO24_12645 [Comamonadaceae bacterium]